MTQKITLKYGRNKKEGVKRIELGEILYFTTNGRYTIFPEIDNEIGIFINKNTKAELEFGTNWITLNLEN